ncbi:major capsid protein [Blackfly microvirus SF02]|uniref:Major capsid protein n=1 Tax=Blackfly microvirus SF02 TaxID=2576452 RepID=A0A4P8PSY6_9VIRU|nr:major capsid protein [Blackfly microvirus SF02]
MASVSNRQTQHNFAQIPRADIPRSSFDRSHGRKSTGDAGYLIPIYVDEALPGDTFNLKLTSFGRLATPLKPFMDNMYLDTFFFAVPYRLVWSNFQKFMGEQNNPGDSTSFLIPQIITQPVGGYTNQSLYDYMGLPTLVATAYPHSAMWLRAYNLIYNTWFRDQNLQDSLTVPLTDGPDAHTLYNLVRRGKRHDYFTSALPWPQKGPAVPLPLTGNATVLLNTANTNSPRLVNASTNVPFATGSSTVNYGTSGNNARIENQSSVAAKFDPNNTLYADLSSVTAATINQLRQSFQIQKLYERDARGGTRYTEIISSHFGVTSPDARLQRPEYLGGGSSPININPIAQTAPTVTGQTPQGNLAAMGTYNLSGHGFTKSFTEHCLLIGIVSARADLSYQQGLNRMWSRNTRFDLYWPALSHIGEQSVLNKEIYLDGSANDNLVFGYQERFAEYRYKPSEITGKFRSNDPQPLDMWHLAQKFLTLPTLSATFIQENPPVDRVVAVPSEPDFLFDFFFQLTCARPMPVYSVPGLIDHF